MTKTNSSHPKRALAIGYVWPEPNSSAAGKHMLSLLQCLIDMQYEVSFASPAVKTEHKIDLSLMGVSEHSIALNCQSFDDFVSQLSPDIVLFDRYMMEEQFGWRVARSAPQALRILDTEDLHFLRHATHQAYKLGQAIGQQHWHNDIAVREIAAIYRSDVTLVISQYEWQLLTEHFGVPAELLHYCPFMLDVSQANQNPLPFDSRQHFVSIGNFRHEPNWDAVLFLKQIIWPGIRKRLPKAQLRVYGAYPPPKATQLHSPKTGFYLDGWVKDAHRALINAKVLLAPLRFGAGIKGKLADAMLAHTPSVTTSIGAQGMALPSHSWPGFITDDIEMYIQQAVKLYQDEAVWTKQASHAAGLLQARFDQNLIAQQLKSKIEETVENLESHRLANFMGKMLQHHSLKSTQYMSQWIEAKNSRQ